MRNLPCLAWFVIVAILLSVFSTRSNAEQEKSGDPFADASAAAPADPVLVPPVAITTPAPGTAPAGGPASATVTLPYAELKQLWQAARDREKADAAAVFEAEPKPPLSAVLRSAAYRLEVSGDDLLLAADYRAENLDRDQWQRLALLEGDFSLIESLPEDALVVRKSNGYELLLPPGAKLELQLRFAAPAALPRGWWIENDLPKFQPAPASVRTLQSVNLPDDLTVTIGNVEWTGDTATPGEGRPRVLPTLGAPLPWKLIKLDPNAPSGRPADDAVPTPVAWQLRSELFAAFDDGKLKFDLHIHARTEAENGGRLLHLLLPVGARGISAEGEGLIRQRELPRAKPTDPRRLELLWTDADRAEREFAVEFELAQSPLANQWTLPLPQSDPPAESVALAVIGVNEGLEISGDEVRAAAVSAGLPRWMMEATAGGDFVSLDLAATRTVDIRWLPRVNTAPAVIAEARAVTRVVADGAILNHSEYVIEHEAPLNWTVSLPADSELLTAFVNGVATRPIQRDATTLELQLPVPKGGGEKSQSVVRLTYAAGVDGFDPVSGSVALSLPDTPLFVHRLLWDVQIPDGYETSAIDGNIAIDTDRERCHLNEKSTGKNDDTRAIQLRKELIRNEAPRVEIFYRSTLTGS